MDPYMQIYIKSLTSIYFLTGVSKLIAISLNS